MENNKNSMEENHEKRWAKRMVLNAKFKLHSITKNPAATYNLNEDEFEVNIINISKGGMAFTTNELLPLHSFYDTKVVLWTKESFESVIEIIRIESVEDSKEIFYGCKFIGLSSADQFKLDVYQIVNEEQF